MNPLIDWTSFFGFLKENKLFTFAIVILLISMSEKIGFIKLSVSEKFKTILFYFGITILIVSVVPHLVEVYKSTVNHIKSEKNTTTSTPTPTPTLTPTPTPTPTLTTSEAVDLIKKYLAAKNNMLGRLHSTDDVDKYTTGELRTQLLDDCGDTKCSDSIPSLIRTNSYYEFPYQEIISNQNISSTNNESTISVTISGVKKFFPLGASKPSDVKSYCGDYIYTFKFDGINWKISAISEIIKKDVCPKKTEIELESYFLSSPKAQYYGQSSAEMEP